MPVRHPASRGDQKKLLALEGGTLTGVLKLSGAHLELDGSLARLKGQNETIADDATATFTIPDNASYSLVFLVTSFNTTTYFIGGMAGTNALSTIYAGSNVDNGGAANNDTDTDVNIWLSAQHTISIKNRLGSERSFTVYFLAV